VHLLLVLGSSVSLSVLAAVGVVLVVTNLLFLITSLLRLTRAGTARLEE
jgi:hypothetical protein